MSPTSRNAREPITVIAELRFDPRHQEAVLELARRHVRNTLAAERDCLRFEIGRASCRERVSSPV